MGVDPLGRTVTDGVGAPFVDGIGIGWRPEIAGVISGLPGLGFTEVVAEAIPSGPAAELWTPLRRLLDRGVPAIAHGIGLSLGGADPLEMARVQHLRHCAEVLGAPLVSEHIAFVRAGGIEAGHLMPVPRTKEALQVLSRNISQTSAELPVPLAVENVAALFEWPHAELTESEFLTELVDRTGVLLLIDVANLYANAVNSGRDPFLELERLPVTNVAYCHVAGGELVDGLYHDTHLQAVSQVVLELAAALAERCRGQGAPVPGFMIERDGHYPPAVELQREYDALRAAVGGARPAELGDPRAQELAARRPA